LLDGDIGGSTSLVPVFNTGFIG